MSGIEVAGLVLAVLPLLIEGAKAYRDGLQPLKGLFEPTAILDTVVRELRIQQQHFRDNLEKLFRTASVPWTPIDSTSISKVSLAHLKSYIQSIDRLEVLEICLEEYSIRAISLAKLLKPIRKPAKDVPVSLESIIAANAPKNGKFSLRRRITLASRYDLLERQLEQLRAIKNEFSEFVDDLAVINHSLQASVYNSGTPRLLTALNRTHEYVRYMLQGFRANWHTACSHSHRLMIQLDPRQARPRKRNKGKSLNQFQFREDAIKFRVLVAHGGIATWRSIHIEGLSSDPVGTTWFHASAYETVRDPGGRPSNPTPGILDPCDSTCSDNLHLGLSPSCQFYKSSQPDVTHKLICHGEDMKSLEALLEERKRLLPVQCHRLALTLATSMLQIHHTHCAESTLGVWTPSSIRFLTTCTDIDLDSPYFHQHFDAAASPPSTQDVVQSEEALFQLGVTFMSLWQGESLEAWADAKGMDVTEYWSRRTAALRWCHELGMAGQILPDFSDAISVCIKSSFEGITTRSWEEDDFRRAVCEKVVVPLMKSCEAYRVQWDD